MDEDVGPPPVKAMSGHLLVADPTCGYSKWLELAKTEHISMHKAVMVLATEVNILPSFLER